MMPKPSKQHSNEPGVRSYTLSTENLALAPGKTVVQYTTLNSIDEFQQRVAEVSNTLAALRVFAKATDVSGSFVKVLPKYSHVPVIVGNDGDPVLLYKFVGALENLLEYEDLLEEFPTLSYGRISGALAFLRNLAQFNTAGVDIDELEDELIEGSEDFQRLLADAAEDQEVTRVLAAG